MLLVPANMMAYMAFSSWLLSDLQGFAPSADANFARRKPIKTSNMGAPKGKGKSQNDASRSARKCFGF